MGDLSKEEMAADASAEFKKYLKEQFPDPKKKKRSERDDAISSVAVLEEDY